MSRDSINVGAYTPVPIRYRPSVLSGENVMGRYHPEPFNLANIYVPD